MDLALGAHALLNLDIAGIDEVPSDNEETAVALIRAACARMGYAIIPYGAAATLRYYEIEVRQNDGRAFVKFLSCPDSVPLDIYVPGRFSFDLRYESFEMLREVTGEEFAARVMRTPTAHHPTGPILTRPSLGASAEEMEVVTLAQQSGLLEVYRKVVLQRHQELNQREPRDIGAHFVGFLRTLTPSKIAGRNLNIVVREFGGRVEVYHSQGITMIVSNGSIRQFLTNRAFTRKIANTRRAIRLNGVVLNPASPAESESVVRTGLGYVPEGARLFLHSLLHFGGRDPKYAVQDVPIKSGK